MIISYKYTLLLNFLLIGSVYASEQPTKCDRVGSWIYNYYGSPIIPKAKLERYTAAEPDIQPKSWSIFSFFKIKPKLNSLYNPTERQHEFPEEIKNEMENVLVPTFSTETPEDVKLYIPTYKELRSSYEWRESPFKYFLKFSDVWARIIGKNVNIEQTVCPIEEQKQIVYGSPEYYKLLQKQKKQAERERTMLDEATKVLDKTQRASMNAKFANDKLLSDLENKWEKKDCSIRHDNQKCRNLKSLYREVQEENKLLNENYLRAYDLSRPLWERKRFLGKTLQNIKYEEKVFTED